MKTPLTAFALLLSASLGCAPGDGDRDMPPQGDAGDASGFTRGGTLHFGEARSAAFAGDRHWFGFYAAGSDEAPIDVEFTAENLGAGDGGTVRLVLFGPLVDGTRERLGDAGTVDAESAVTLNASLTETGSYALVVAQHDSDASENTRFALDAACLGGDCEALDAVVSHRVGAMAGNGSGGMVAVALNTGLDEASISLVREVSGAPEVLDSTRTTSGTAMLQIPSDVEDGTDIDIVVEGVDDGVRVRVWRNDVSGVYVPGILVSDTDGRISVSGVGPYMEGAMSLTLRSRDRGHDLAEEKLAALLPGQPGLGLGTFDVEFEVSADRSAAPADGEVLEVGIATETSGFFSLGCFRFCGDVAGNSCAANEPVDCPGA